MKTKTKRILQAVAVTISACTVSTLVACGSPQEEEQVPQYPDYSETRVGAGEEFAMYEVRFTDTEGNKIKCYVVDGYRMGGLDQCEKVG